MIKIETKRKKVTTVIIILLLISTAFTGFDSAAFATVRNIDIATVFVCGVLTGALIMTVKNIVLAGKKS